MDMPKTCASCRLKDFYLNLCLAAGRRVSVYGMNGGLSKPRWCPLVEVEENEEGVLTYRGEKDVCQDDSNK